MKKIFNRKNSEFNFFTVENGILSEWPRYLFFIFSIYIFRDFIRLLPKFSIPTKQVNKRVISCFPGVIPKKIELRISVKKKINCYETKSSTVTVSYYNILPLYGWQYFCI